MFIHRSLTAAGLLVLLAASAGAQESAASPQGRDGALRDFLNRSSVGISLSQTRPQGALGRNIGFGYGVNGAYAYRLDRAGVVSIRADVAAVQYGRESKRSAFSESVGGRVQVDTRTTNYLVPVTIGPQLTAPAGAIRPYINAGLGAQIFATESVVEGFGTGALASTTNQSDATMIWAVGGGIYVPFVRGTSRAQLDLNVQYIGGGHARYLAPGSITDFPGGAVRISPFESATNLVVVRVGARIGR